MEWTTLGWILALMWIVLPRPVNQVKEVEEALHMLLLEDEIREDRLSRSKGDD